MQWLIYIAAGAAGGFIRSLITGKGIIPLPKVQEANGSKHLNLGFLAPMAIGALAGYLAPSTLGVDSVVATMAGYSGSDFIENIIERRLGKWMRYAIISLGRPISEVEALARQWGGRDIRVAPLLGQVFCHLEPEKAILLAREPGIAVRAVREHTISQTQAPVVAAQYSLTDLFTRAHNLASPPLTGVGSTIAILDSGINKEHKVLKDKVVYEANFSLSLLVGDQFDHGTGVAYLAAGGKPGDAVVGAAPGAYIVSLKVMGDDGETPL